MTITALQIRTARQLLGLSLIQLSKDASLAPSTLCRLESGVSTQKLTRLIVRKILEAYGAEFHMDGSVSANPSLRVVSRHS